MNFKHLLVLALLTCSQTACSSENASEAEKKAQAGDASASSATNSANNDKAQDITLAQNTSAKQQPDVRAALLSAMPQMTIDSISDSAVPGFYEVISDGQILYVSQDATHLFYGTLLGIEPGGMRNLTKERMDELEQEKAPKRAAAISELSESDMVIFKAPKEEHVLTVFTDVDCGYCRKLHREISDYNELGITIRYLAFPRAGLASGSFNKLVSIWCAEDPQQAMTQAKLNGKIEPKNCDNPIAEQYKLTREFGLRGTPALLLEDGELIAGYVPPKELKELLSKRVAQQ